MVILAVFGVVCFGFMLLGALGLLIYWVWAGIQGLYWGWRGHYDAEFRGSTGAGEGTTMRNSSQLPEVSSNLGLFLATGLALMVYMSIGAWFLGCLRRRGHVPLADGPRIYDFLVALGAITFWPLIATLLLLERFWKREP